MLLFPWCMWAQETVVYRFDRYTQRDGLSNNQVQCILQDSDGWMWFGTTYGLNRFDGVSFRTFKSENDDSTTLTANLVRTIFEDSRKELWIGMENGGLCRYDKDRECFIRYPLGKNGLISVNGITEDAAGHLWLATAEGLIEGVSDAGGNYRFNPVLLDLRSSHLKKVLVDRHNHIWLATEQGLYVYETARRKLMSLELPETANIYDEIWALYMDRTDRIWIGTYNSGLFYVNPWELKVVKTSFTPGIDRAQTIRAICSERDGKFWIGTRAGLFSFDGAEYEYHPISEDSNAGGEINSILSLCVDAKGDLWIGCRQGIHHFVYEKQFITSYTIEGPPGKRLNNGDVYAIKCEKDRVWIGTEAGGLNKLDRKTGQITCFTRQNSGLTSNCVKALLLDGPELWVGTYMGGISVLNANTGQVIRQLHHIPDQRGGISDDRIWAFARDTEGNIWIGTSKGVDLYDRKTKIFHYREDIIRGTQVNWIKQDSEGDIWVGGEDQLVIYRPLSGKVQRYFRKTRDMLEFPSRQYYVTTTNGLACFDKERGFYRFYTEKEGLVNNYTLSLEQGLDSTLWISTANGLSLWNLTDGSFKNFQEKDGLQDNQFNYGASDRDEAGNLFFGGINGFNRINPEQVTTNTYVPPVVITDFRIFNRKVKVGEGKHPVLKQNVAYTDEVRLPYDRNMLSFSFVALNYVMAEKNRYRYRLEGLEDRWVNAGNLHRATYANLAPGSYVFRVQGSNNDGVWNREGASLRVVIIPPFWQTWWFTGILGIVILLIAFLIARAYVYREKMKNMLVLEKTKARHLHEVDMLKLQFFTNVSHDIRTPLTLIIGPVEKLYRQVKDEDIRVQLGMVYQNARKLLQLINQLLDFRKLEAGQYKVEYESGDVVRFLRERTETFRYPAYEKNIDLSFESNRDKWVTAFDGDKLDKILNNLLSNALKFTGKNGRIRVGIEIGEDDYRIIVEDSGVGIAPEHLDRIFNRFFQSANSSDITGTGIGLSITKNFVELMGGTIEVSSVQDKGTVFAICLPVHQEQPEEMIQAEEPRPEDKVLLVVDDNEDIRVFIRTHFKAGYRVVEAADGKAGYEAAIREIPDVILADMLMPVMDGQEMCKRLKKDEHTSHIPVIMLTAVNSKEKELESILVGVDDYITKPFDINILSAKVDNLLQIRNALREKVKNDLLMQPSEVKIDSPNDRFLKKAVEVVEKYMDDPELDIGRFAEEMGVSRMQLYRKFEALANMTVKEFIRSIRLKRAAQLLEQEKLNVSEIAWAVGFKDISYFRKCFKEEFGKTPSEYSKFKD